MLNCWIAVGRLCKEVALAKTKSGLDVATFDLAVDDSYKQADGTKNTTFMRIKVLGKAAASVGQYCHKGSLVSVKARLSQYKYTSKKTNQQMTAYEAIADSVEFLDAKPAAKEDAKPSDEEVDDEPDAQ